MDTINLRGVKHIQSINLRECSINIDYLFDFSSIHSVRVDSYRENTVASSLIIHSNGRKSLRGSEAPQWPGAKLGADKNRGVGDRSLEFANLSLKLRKTDLKIVAWRDAANAGEDDRIFDLMVALADRLLRKNRDPDFLRELRGL